MAIKYRLHRFLPLKVLFQIGFTKKVWKFQFDASHITVMSNIRGFGSNNLVDEQDLLDLKLKHLKSRWSQPLRIARRQIT